MLKNIFLDVFSDTWPTILIAVVIAVSLRLAYLLKGHKKIILYKELLMLIFIIYALCLFHVVTYQDVNFGTNNFIPFKEIFRYDLGTPKFIKNIIGNIIMFIPFGFFASYFLKSKKISIPLILTIILTTTIETVQYYIGRVFDIDDIILNIVGGILGYLLFITMDFLQNKIPGLKNNHILNLLIIIIIVIIVIYGFDINIFGLYG